MGVTVGMIGYSPTLPFQEKRTVSSKSLNSCGLFPFFQNLQRGWLLGGLSLLRKGARAPQAQFS